MMRAGFPFSKERAMPIRRHSAAAPNFHAISDELSTDNSPSSPLVDRLNRHVANAFVLYANYKHYHWQTFGPLFRDLHKLFDEFAHDVLGSIDEFAERVRMIGPDPPAHLTRLTEMATVAPSSDGNRSMRQMVEEANRNALIVIKALRETARMADEHDDPGTVDLCSKAVQVYEKQEWWLRDMLRKHDGLCSD
jgi:starvation-inducible DNA-binding protein